MDNHKRVLALGFFDGVHIGHAKILTLCAEAAASDGNTACVLTFDTHPDALVLGSSQPLLNSAADRRELMERLGITEIIALPFDERVMKTPWRDFVSALKDRGAVSVVAGHDFRFGYKGEGDAAMLSEECAKLGMGCAIVPEVKLDGITVSSTYIRKLVAEGDMERAAEFLGHYHTLGGVVEHGNHIGTTIGYPTANLALPTGVIAPKYGVYVTRVTFGGVPYTGITNVGMRPTVNDGQGVTVETVLSGFGGNLYGKEIRLEFIKFLREERAFAGVYELKAQIARDIDTIRFFVV